MKPELFVDTSAWVALSVSSDGLHEKARQFADASARDFRWVTTNWVLAEAATFLRRRAGHLQAVRFHRSVERSSRLTIHTVGAEEEARAWSIFDGYTDKAFSVVDCTSFAVMEYRGIGAAFAFDGHFSQYGFVQMP